MTFGQFISILRARWLSALVVFFVVVATAVGVSLVLPKKYTATAAVVIDVKAPDLFNAQAVAGMLMPSYMATQVDMIQSERVILRAINDLKLNQNAELRQQWQEDTEGRGNFEAWLAEALQKKLDVKPSRESNVITIGYSSPSPQFSAAMVNAVVQGYTATALDMRVEPAKQYNSFFDQRAKEMRDNLEAAQTRLSAYQRQKGILATDERLDIETARLNELSSQLVMLQATAAETSGRQAQAGANPNRMQEVLNSPLVAGLTADASRQEARLQELSTRLGDKHPQVIELRDNIAALRARVASESSRVVGSVGINDRVNQGRVAVVRSALAEQRTKVLKMKEQRDEASVLQRDAESAQRAYETVLARASQTGMESQNTQTNVSLLKRATEPTEPSSPKILLNALLAVFVGTLLAVGTALLRELLDRRLRNAEDVVQVLNQPLLGVMSNTSRLHKLSGGKRSALLQHRVLAGLPRG